MKRRSEKLYRKLAKEMTINIAILHGTGPFITRACYSDVSWSKPNATTFWKMDGENYIGSVFYVEDRRSGKVVWAVRYPNSLQHGFEWTIEQLEDFIFEQWTRRLEIRGNNGEP